MLLGKVHFCLLYLYLKVLVCKKPFWEDCLSLPIPYNCKWSRKGYSFKIVNCFIQLYNICPLLLYTVNLIWYSVSWLTFNAAEFHMTIFKAVSLKCWQFIHMHIFIKILLLRVDLIFRVFMQPAKKYNFNNWSILKVLHLLLCSRCLCYLF